MVQGLMDRYGPEKRFHEVSIFPAAKAWVSNMAWSDWRHVDSYTCELIIQTDLLASRRTHHVQVNQLSLLPPQLDLWGTLAYDTQSRSLQRVPRRS